MRKLLVLGAAIVAILSLVTVAQGDGYESGHVWFFGNCQNPYDSPDFSAADSGGGYFLGGGCRGIGVFAGDWDNESIAEYAAYEAGEEFGGSWEVDYLKAINIFGGPPVTGARYGCGSQDPISITPQTFGGGLWIAIFSVVPCEPVCVPPVETLLAVAYIDNNTSDGGYDPCVDTLIAKLIDEDSNDVPSVGDTVVTNQYPLGFDPGTDGLGTFGVTQHTVGSVFEFNSTRISLFLGAGNTGSQFRFQRDGYIESYTEAAPGETAIEDNYFGTGSGDFIKAESSTVSQPGTAVSELLRADSTDDAFIDVEINFIGSCSAAITISC